MTKTSSARVSARGEKTRAALLRAGLELFSTKPVDAVAINDIVELANVAKGSFFNHFQDKHAFAVALANEVRLDIETLIEVGKQSVDDPVRRMALGMRMGVEFALTQRSQTVVMLSAQEHAAVDRNPLNEGVSTDVREAVRGGDIRPEASAWGVLFWLGLCQTIMAATIYQPYSRDRAADGLNAMVTFGLSGLGVPPWKAAQIAQEEADTLRKASSP